MCSAANDQDHDFENYLTEVVRLLADQGIEFQSVQACILIDHTYLRKMFLEGATAAESAQAIWATRLSGQCVRIESCAGLSR